ncbi:MAG: hypothetical protein QF752_11185 [Planctomycetota bacterium]|nr:hypothetical protein [Planctomycetota bacterium]
MLKLYSLIVVGFWILMMVFLVQREILPEMVPVRSGYQAVLSDLGETPRREKMRIHFHGQSLGTSWTEMKRTGEGYRIIQHVKFSTDSERTLADGPIGTSFLQLLGLQAESRVIQEIGSDFQLRSVQVQFRLGGMEGQVDGVVEGHRMRLIGGMKGESVQESFVDVPKGMLWGNHLSPLHGIGRLRVGATSRFGSVDPMTRVSTVYTTQVLERLTPVAWEGGMMDVFKVQVTSRMSEWFLEITEDGTVLRQDGPMGLSMVRESLGK